MDVKILWDFEVRTDHVISACRPDIIVLNYKKRCSFLIDVAIPYELLAVSVYTILSNKTFIICSQVSKLSIKHTLPNLHRCNKC